MKLFNKINDRITTRKRKHVNYVADQIIHLRYAIINDTLSYARKQMCEDTFHNKVGRKALLLAKYERYKRQLHRWI